MRTCDHCGSTFTSPQPRAKYCGKRCKQAAKDQRRKPQRLERDRKRNGITSNRYRKTDPASVAAKFRLKPTSGFTDGYTPLHDGDF